MNRTELVAQRDRLLEALQLIEFGMGQGCPDCGATGTDDDWHRTCCIIGNALYPQENS